LHCAIGGSNLQALFNEADSDADGALEENEFRLALRRQKDLSDSPFITALLRYSFEQSSDSQSEFSAEAFRVFLSDEDAFRYREIGLFWRPTPHFFFWSLHFCDREIEHIYRNIASLVKQRSLALELAVHILMSAIIFLVSAFSVQRKCSCDQYIRLCHYTDGSVAAHWLLRLAA
jgi:hypothetical protein